MKRPNPKSVNPYDSKGLLRTKLWINKKRKNPKNVNPYETQKH